MLSKLRILGIHLLLLAAVGGAATAASLTFGRMPQNARVGHFPVLPARLEPAITTGPAWLAMKGIPSNVRAARRWRRSAAMRVIVVSPWEVRLRVGGQVVRAIPSRQRSPSLTELVRLIADNSWISRPRPGVTYLKAGLMLTAGTSMTVAPPAARLLLADRPGVFVCADHATLVINSATVESTRPQYTGAYRPFVLADKHSRMQITKARLTGLGWDWSDSYGVAWKNGSTGGATRSTFSHNYFGLYTGSVSGLKFSHDTVVKNYFYGFDPHTYSRNLTITENTVAGNGRHGIIFSGHVTGSTVAGNTVQGNAANGIMMDEGSTGNVIRDNVVTGNHGDGIVLASSPANQIAGNTVRGNRVGLRLTRTGPRSVRLVGNRVAGNSLNVEGIAETSGNTIASDTRLAWNGDSLAVIGVLGAALAMVTLISLRSCLLSGREAR